MLDSDLWYSFRASRVTVAAAATTGILFLGALLAPWISPQDPFDPAALNLLDAFLPPAWLEDGMARYLLGTDDQGHDMFSVILHGSRVSLLVGFASVALAMSIGVTLGLIAGYFGGFVDSFVMRIADVQLTFPAILSALLIDGVMRGLLPAESHDALAIPVLVLAIGLSQWVNFARTVRGSTLVERNKEYVQAARLIGLGPLPILFRHILPNVMGPVLVIGTIGLAVSILLEATLSFLGIGIRRRSRPWAP